MPVGYGIKKLQISCVVEDDKVSTDDLEDQITGLEDFVSNLIFRNGATFPNFTVEWKCLHVIEFRINITPAKCNGFKRALDS